MVKDARQIVEKRIQKGKKVSKNEEWAREGTTQKGGLIEGVDSPYQWQRIEEFV